MGEMLSQEEINALLRGIDEEPETHKLSDTEIDAIGEVSNISMGTAATTLFSLVNQKVMITTPKVEVTNWEKISQSYDKSFVTIQIVYKEGLSGSNLLILKENDVKIIADLMMGGEGNSFEGELTELHLSAIGEAMNQMIGSAATSMSSMFGKKIDIKPPVSNYIDNSEFVEAGEIEEFLTRDFIKVSFDMKIGELIDSEMMQLYPIEFAKDIYKYFSASKENEAKKNQAEQKAETAPQQPQSQPEQMDNGMAQSPQFGGMNSQFNPQMNPQLNPQMNPQMNQQFAPQMNPYMGMNPFGGMNPYAGMNSFGTQQPSSNLGNIEVSQAQFQTFDMGTAIQQKENIDLIMDVALEVTVELGRTRKSIKDILEFAPGTIIELNKLAGEPVDVLVNGKIVAKGEVVVIDENFGIRITEIIKHNAGIM